MVLGTKCNPLNRIFCESNSQAGLNLKWRMTFFIFFENRADVKKKKKKKKKYPFSVLCSRARVHIANLKSNPPALQLATYCQ